MSSDISRIIENLFKKLHFVFVSFICLLLLLLFVSFLLQLLILQFFLDRKNTWSDVGEKVNLKGLLLLEVFFS